jgi:hypothetical protein
MFRQLAPPSIVFSSLCLLLVAGCGGGGGSSAVVATVSNNAPTNTPLANPATTTPTVAVPVVAPVVPTTALTLDLKNATTASTLAAVIIDQLTPPNVNSIRTSNYNKQVNDNRPYDEALCAAVNSGCEVIFSAGPIVTVGDYMRSIWTQLQSGDKELRETKNGEREERTTAITGNASDASLQFTVEQQTTERTTTIFDRPFNTVNNLEKLYAVTDLDFYQLRKYRHEGFSTATETDDIDYLDIDVIDLSSGSANGQVVSRTKISSIACSQLKNALTTCSKTDGTFSGNYIQLGTFNITVKLLTLLQFDAITNDPIAGSILLSQGNDKVTLAFSRGADSSSQVKVTDATGAAQTLTFLALKSLAANLF